MDSNIFYSPFGEQTIVSDDALVASVHLSDVQAITKETLTLVQFDTALFDAGSWLDDETHKITPTTAGYYRVSLSCTITDSDGGLIYSEIQKNDDSIADFRTSMGSDSLISTHCEAIVYMNGTTDYLTGHIWHNNTTTQNLSKGSAAGRADRTHMEINFIGVTPS